MNADFKEVSHLYLWNEISPPTYQASIFPATNPGCKVREQLSKTWNKTYDGVLSDDKCYATRCMNICHELELCYGTILKANVEFTFFVELEGENVFLFRTTLERNCYDEVNTAVRIWWLFLRIGINFETSEKLDTFLTKAFEMKPLVFQLVLLAFSSLVLAG